MRNNKTISYILSILILLLSVVAVGENSNRVSKTSATADFYVTEDMKGIWLSYITLDMQSTDQTEESFTNKIKSIVETTKESGFNTLIVQVRPFSDAIYKSKYYPWSHILTGTQGKAVSYDPLEIICDISHKHQISVHAWINPYRVKSENTPQNLSSNNPYTKDKSIGFTHNGNVYLDPSNKKAQKLITEGVAEIIKNYDVDGIQFDDYFYPENSDSADNDKYNEYKKSTDKPLSKEKWRTKNVSNLIKNVYSCIKKINENIVFGISPQGNINNNYALSADVKTWCKTHGYIDYICPQIYFSLDNPTLAFEECLNQWIKLKKHSKLKLYIGLAGYKGGTDNDNGTWLDNNDILKTEIQICKEKQTDGIMLYSYESFLNKENLPEIQNVVNHLKGISK